MNVNDVMTYLEQAAPLNYALEWDNCGLLIGNGEKEVKTIYIALDATDDVIEEAVRHGADLLLTHHPLLFHGVKSIREDDFIGRRVIKLVQSNITYCAMHTNFDVCVMAKLAADYLGLKQDMVLEVTGTREDKACGIGRIGQLAEPVALRECAAIVKKGFTIPSVRLYGDLEHLVERVAIVPGSGKSEISYAIDEGADVLITGDIGHHEGIDALAQGLSIIDAGHQGLEHIFETYMKQYLQKLDASIQILVKGTQSPFSVL